jgi:hypothetical protein
MKFFNGCITSVLLILLMCSLVYFFVCLQLIRYRYSKDFFFQLSSWDIFNFGYAALNGTLEIAAPYIILLPWAESLICFLISVGAAPVVFFGSLLGASDQTGFTINAIRECAFLTGFVMILWYITVPILIIFKQCQQFLKNKTPTK